jgi:error-prone DNA polymerase
VIGDRNRRAVGESLELGTPRHARQRPETASGIVFMLLEDEHGTINLVVPAAIYERHRLIVRTEPLVHATGRLERPAAGAGTINVLVRSLRTLERELDERPAADVTELPIREAQPPAEDEGAAAAGGGFRAVAPPVQSFAAGRRR